MKNLLNHILAMSDDSYLDGHPEWNEIVKEARALKAEESYISSISTDNTGGNIYNDVIELKDGIIIRIGEGTVSVFSSSEEDEENNPLATVMLP
jgi:hypothetical protein